MVLDLNKLLETTKKIVWEVLQIPFEIWYRVPLYIKIPIYIILIIVVIFIIVLLWKNRDGWKYVYF